MNWNLPLYLMLYLEKSNNSKTWLAPVPAWIAQISKLLKSPGSILGAATQIQPTSTVARAAVPVPALALGERLCSPDLLIPCSA